MLLSRRKFVHIAGIASAGLLTGIGCSEESSSNTQTLKDNLKENQEEIKSDLREVMFYEKLNTNRIKCTIAWALKGFR